jgi:hypothetical protein
MSSTIKIKAPAMPEPTRQEEQAPFEAWADNYSPSGDCESLHRQWKESSWRESWLQERDAYYRERDAQWQEMVGPLLEIAERAKRLVEHADFKLGGILSASSKAREIPSNAASSVKARHLALLRDSLVALSAITEE